MIEQFVFIDCTSDYPDNNTLQDAILRLVGEVTDRNAEGWRYISHTITLDEHKHYQLVAIFQRDVAVEVDPSAQDFLELRLQRVQLSSDYRLLAHTLELDRKSVV